MRMNLPVTGHEYLLRPDAALVSCTDLKGRITYANPAFVEASGFALEELLGQPHNIVRHPDMPPAAFADLWACLARGVPWTGLVQNRRKDGDAYWVRANVTPMRRGGATLGYMSVRGCPDRAEVASAERLYRDLRENPASRIALRGGEAVPMGWIAPLALLRRIPVQRRVGVVTATAALASLAAAGGGLLAGAVPAAAAVLLAASGLGWAGFGWFLRQTVFAPLEQATQVARAIAGGDLQRFQVRPQDEMRELLQALNQMSANLSGVVADVGANVEGVLDASARIASGNQDLSARTLAQASALEQTAAAMEQLTSTVKQTTDNARHANELALSASAVAVEGGQAVARVVDTMGAIDTSARRIVDIVALIDGIAFQTNILALNAAVEAARAGPQGRGFAVVATEVRHLAQRVTSAAREIKGLVEASVAEVEQGSRRVEQAGRTMQDIVASVQRVTGIMAAIDTASREQAIGLEQINQAVTQMDQVTQQNAALVEQAAASSAGLEQQARQLSVAVGIFRSRAAAAPAPAAAAPARSGEQRPQAPLLRTA